MLGGGTRQAAGMTTPPSPGPEHAEHPWMQKADTPMSYLNETLRALLGFKYAFSQPDPAALEIILLCSEALQGIII